MSRIPGLAAFPIAFAAWATFDLLWEKSDRRDIFVVLAAYMLVVLQIPIQFIWGLGIGLSELFWPESIYVHARGVFFLFFAAGPLLGAVVLGCLVHLVGACIAGEHVPKGTEEAALGLRRSERLLALTLMFIFLSGELDLYQTP